MNMKIIKKITFIIVSIFLAGCVNTHEQKIEKLDKLYEEYNSIDTQDLARQKEKLLKIVSFATPYDENDSEMFFNASCLMIAYLRLYVLAERLGDVESSEFYFYKARYWNIIRWEACGESKDKIYKINLKFTPESSKKFILGLEKVALDAKNGVHQMTIEEARDEYIKNYCPSDANSRLEPPEASGKTGIIFKVRKAETISGDSPAVKDRQ